MKVTTGYTFDDVLLVPQHSDVISRETIDLGTDLGKGVKLKVPIVSANMKTVTGPKMASAIARYGGLPILHRFGNQLQDLMLANTFVFNTKYENAPLGISIGVHEQDKEQLESLMSVEPPPAVICIDVAHGDHVLCEKMIEWVAKKHPEALLVAGNVATGYAALRLWNAGADVIKVGVGPGSLCTTRVETGNGVPQLTALEDVHNKVKQAKIIADGGIRSAGDIVKALCFSHAVMIGNLLAGTDEAPGDLIQRDGVKFKTYVGSSTHKTTHIEGVAALVPYKGPVANVLQKLVEGVASGFSYQGARNLEELREDPQFVTVSNAGLVESRPHDVLL
jgi:IMP dehydrogenase